MCCIITILEFCPKGFTVKFIRWLSIIVWGNLYEGCQKLAFMALGPGVRTGHMVPENYMFTQQDLCPTIGYIVDVPTPFSEGYIIFDIFEPEITGVNDTPE